MKKQRCPRVQEGTVSLMKVFSKAQYRRSALLAVAVAVFQQLSGINTVIFYSTGILNSCGVSSPIYATALFGAVNVLFTVVSAYLVDSAGRKTLLVLSHAGCGASLAVLTGAIYTQGMMQKFQYPWLPMCCVLYYPGAVDVCVGERVSRVARVEQRVAVQDWRRQQSQACWRCWHS